MFVRAVGGVTIAVSTAIVLVRLPADEWASALLALLLSLVGAAVAWRRSTQVPSDQALPWQLFAAGGLVSVLANSLWLTANHTTHLDRLASQINLLELAILACFLGGMYALARIRSYGRQVERVVDGALIASMPAVLAWEAVLQHALERGVAVTAVVNTLALFVAGTMMVWIAGVLIEQGRRPPSLWLIVGSAVAFTIQGVLMVVALDGAVAAEPGHTIGVAIDTATLTGGGFAVLAALHPSALRLTTSPRPQEPSLSPGRVALLGLSLAGVPLGLTLGELTAGDQWFYGLFGLVSVALAAVRVLDVIAQRDAAIVRRDAAQESLRKQAMTDPVTGLPNRQYVDGALEAALESAQEEGRGDRPCAVLFMDLDDFKLVNDSFGHEAGDHVLITVAERLLASREESELVVRFGGDEFIVIVPEVADDEQARAIAGRYLSATSALETLDGVEVRVNASIGIALSSGAGTTPSSLIADADAAMYRAKGSSDRIVVFNDDLRTATLSQLRVEQGLRRAIAEDGLSVAYQPIVDLDTGGTVAIEALVRWADDDHGPYDASEFIAVAEHSGLIHPLGRFVLETVARQWRAWADGGVQMPINVNVSARELVRADYVADLLSIIAMAGMPPPQLTLELTERDAADAEALVEVLADLRSAGVQIAVDDFGTGYFSLAQLRQIPIDILKVDRTFVTDMLTDPAAEAIVIACLGMAAGLGLDAVAEGAETMEQRRRLGQLGCRYAQGYSFGRPDRPESVGLNGPAHDLGVKA